MILVDANLLIYAYIDSFPQHLTARNWLESVLNGEGRVGLPWAVSLAFVRLVSNPKVFERAIPLPVAWQQIEEWLELPTVWIPSPGSRYRQIMGALIPDMGSRPKLVPDGHLAALAIEQNIALYSADRDFARFSGLRWVNPLKES